MGSSQTRARTCVPCIGRQTLNHCATREALLLLNSSAYFIGILCRLNESICAKYVIQCLEPKGSTHLSYYYYHLIWYVCDITDLCQWFPNTHRRSRFAASDHLRMFWEYTICRFRFKEFAVTVWWILSWRYGGSTEAGIIKLAGRVEGVFTKVIMLGQGSSGETDNSPYPQVSYPWVPHPWMRTDCKGFDHSPILVSTWPRAPETNPLWIWRDECRCLLGGGGQVGIYSAEAVGTSKVKLHLLRTY